MLNAVVVIVKKDIIAVVTMILNAVSQMVMTSSAMLRRKIKI